MTDLKIVFIDGGILLQNVSTKKLDVEIEDVGPVQFPVGSILTIKPTHAKEKPDRLKKNVSSL